MACPGGSAGFAIMASSADTSAYQWQIQTAAGTWSALGNGPLSLPCGGAAALIGPPAAATVSVTISPCPAALGTVQRFQLRAAVTNFCGTSFSAGATYTVCPADFDCSGDLTVQDIFAFLGAWFGGDAAADFNGNGLSVQDIFDFLGAWFAGC
jgi:hypothetical protein